MKTDRSHSGKFMRNVAEVSEHNIGIVEVNDGRVMRSGSCGAYLTG